MSQRYFLTAESTYEDLRQYLNTALSYPNALGKSVFQTALYAPRDSFRRVLLAVDTAIPGYATISAAVQPLLDSDAVEEIDEATYLAALATATGGGATFGTVTDTLTYTNFLTEAGSLATALSDIDGALDGKAAASHTHDGGDISFTLGATAFSAGTDSPVASFLWGVDQGDSGHLVDNFLKISLDNSYAAVSHNHSASEITSGVIATARLASSGTASATTFLRGDQTWATVTSGDTVSIDTTAADILSASSGSITADDPGADRIVFWDDSATKLTHLSVGSGLSISGTTLSAGDQTVTSPSQITSNQNDYASFARGINRFTTDASRNLTGMVAGSDGEVRILTNVGTTAANTLVIKDESASSTAANRFSVPWNGDCVIAAEASIVCYYDGTSSRWRVV